MIMMNRQKLSSEARDALAKMIMTNDNDNIYIYDK